MVRIPDWSGEPIRTPEEIEADKAEIEAYLATWRQEREQNALIDFYAVGSYVERFRTAKVLNEACSSSGSCWSREEHAE